MKKLVLVGIGLFMMVSFSQTSAKQEATQSHVECFGTTCGFVGCVESSREFTNKERLALYDLLEEVMCEN